MNVTGCSNTVEKQSNNNYLVIEMLSVLQNSHASCIRPWKPRRFGPTCLGLKPSPCTFLLSQNISFHYPCPNDTSPDHLARLAQYLHAEDCIIIDVSPVIDCG